MVMRYDRRREEMDKSCTALDALLATYALYNRSEGKANSSISWYEDKLRGFLPWVEGKGYSAHLGAFTVDRVREFILHLQRKAEK